MTAPVRAVKCPVLAAPPPAVVDALAASGRSDPKSAEWVVGLEKHYQKLDVCD
ncbi:hypothetical protein [Roseixanthobacter pseudopolyaromaticivorans]|uniref:hypothetical protein n=1 Tax=Xanthobacteraceae TaxID=335928 RepID=UPI003729FB99